MGMFEDVKAMGRFESAETEELKRRFSLLESKYKSALNMIESLSVQLVNAQTSAREEKQRLEKECAETRSAFATVMDELKRSQRQKAAITGSRNHWKRECEAMGMLYHLEAEENEKLRRGKTVSPELKPTPVQGVFQFENAEPVQIAAAIGK